MWSRLRSEAGPPASVSSQAALAGQDNRRAEISYAWNSLNQTKAALRHIENRLEAAPGTGVLLDSVLDTKKASVSGGRKISRRDGRHVEESGSKSRTRSRRSPDKSSRSPLRNSTLDSNARKLSAVEFREPLVSYREASPLPVSHTHSEPEVHSLPTEVGVPQADFALSQLVYQRDTRDMQTADLDSLRSSAVDSTSVRYLNDLSALNTIHQPDQAPLGSTVNPRTHLQAETSQTSLTSITGSVTASLRLENLRRRQPDEKLEKLKERIRRQREHLEETEETNKLLGYLEQPVGIGAAANSTTVPTAKVRKVAPAPPAPIYKGFNTSETKIRTPDGKVWAEEDFHNLSREIYKDLTKQLTGESTKPKQRPAERERVKEKKASKPVRKVHRSSSAPDSNTKPAISTSSWRDGQKLVKMMLGPPPTLHREPQAKSSETQMRTAPTLRSSSDPRLERSRRSRPTSAERPCKHIPPEDPAGPPRSTGGDRRKSPSTDLLSADIRGILDDLQLEEDSSRRAKAPRSKVRSSTRVSRSASPAKTTKSADAPEHPMAKKRHYDAEAVRLYIAQKQEERKKRQAEERRAQREEEENKNKRLQELYRRQRAGATKGPVAPEGPIKKRLQETYTKLLLEQTQLREEINGCAETNIVQQPRPVYQPSGESDKENKRHDRPQSATSSSDLSLTEQCQPPFSRNGLGFAGSPWLQSDQRSPALRDSSSLAPPSGHIFSQLLELDPEPSLPNRESLIAHAAFPSTISRKMSRIEALKATAASLSSRIESEARKLAGAGINYGCARDTGTGLLIPNSDCWAKPVSPPVRENPTDSDDLVERIEKLLAAGQSTYDQALPGVGNLHSFRERMETGNKQTLVSPGLTSRNARKTPSPPKPVVQEVELDSSGGSISEGPLLSEGSISDEDLQELPKSRLGTTGYSAHLNGDSLNPISRFQREAEKHLPFNVSSIGQGGSNGPWEELAKGSPHSVINIFTKNMSYSKAIEERGGKSSPALRSALSGASSLDGMVYEEDFVSSHASSQSASKKSPNGLSNGHGQFSPPEEVLSGRSAYSNRAGERSQYSPALTPLSSPHSASSSSKRASERSLLEGQRNTSSAVSDLPSECVKKSGSEKASSRSSHRSVDTDSTLGGVSVHSIHSHFGSEGKKSPRSARTTPAAGSPASSGSSRLSPGESISIRGSAKGSGSPHAALPSSSSSSSSAARAKSNPSPHTQSPGRTDHRTPGSAELQFAPGVLQQRLSAELSYLDAVEESVRQLGDVERVRGVSLAQQETVSLAQILKSQQQRHERELYLLRMKAEQEALETQRQLEESRQKAARAHAELQESLLQSQQQTLGGLHEATSKMINQQAEAARHTAETALHIKEMTELARSQIAGTLSVPGPSITTLYQKQHNHGLKQQQPHPHTDSSWKSELSPERRKSQSEAETPTDSLSESIHSRRPTISGGGSSSTPLSPPNSDQKERKTPGKVRISSSVEDQAHTAADDSLCSDTVRSPLEEKDSASIATEYSVKFDDSMTEDDIEERSFRSLLPSEAHRRESLDRKPSPHPESDDDHSHDRSSPRASSKQDGSMPFSSGQDSFSKFTMDLVRQYMKEEEVRAQHQSSLLRLRQKALREKTKAELAWLEHQKRHLRDKGEDDKMPPLRKKQRGLILKLQQEQAEIKRLQEANKAARRERQLLLKQQEEIERMRHTTLKLKERLKTADTKLESPVSGVAEESAPPSMIVTDTETRSPSPMSVSGSETSSIMQKLKKMRSHMDEKHCSPVHYFFSVFTAHHWASLSVCLPKLHPKFQLFIYSQLVRFLTKREQQLMQRRRHAEELLEWRQRLDAEEAEVRRMEKQALAVWEKQQQQPRNRTPLQQRSRESERSKTSGGEESPTGQEAGSEDDSPALSVSSVHTDLSVPEQLASSSSDQPVSELHSPHTGNSPAPDTLYSPEFNATDSKQSPPEKASLSSLRHSDSNRSGTVTGISGSSKMQVRSSSKTNEAHTSDPHSATPSETTSDQSDIESRIRALKDELRKRKSVVYQLKKEQKKRQKERLKAQEASLLKQLESYNDFIQKTKAELSKEPDSTPATKPQIKTPTSATEKPRIKPPPLQRPETIKNWKIVTESEKSEIVPTETSADKDDVAPSTLHKYSSEHDDIFSDEDPPTVTPTPIMGSPEHMDVLRSLRSPEYPSQKSEDAPSVKKYFGRPEANDLLSEDESVVSSHKSGIMEELEYAKWEGSENDQSDQHSYPLLKLDLGLQIPSLNDMKPRFDEGRLSEKDADKPAVEDSADAAQSMRFTDSPVVKSNDIDYPSAEKTPSAIDHSYTRDFSLSKREDSPKMKDTPSPSGDGYNDDFESSFGSSFKENNHDSKPTSPYAPEPKEKSVKSPIYSSEEEIEEELSVRSGSTNGSFQNESHADLNSIGKGSKEDIISHSICSTSPQPQMPVLPVKDELPSFCIGDRVLVSNIQPGTLRFKGQTNFANGFWAGVELDNPEGSNNGTYDGVVYFECREKHGIFAPPDKISHLPEKFEASADTEDEDSSCDDQPNSKNKRSEIQLEHRNLLNKIKGEKSDLDLHPETREPLDEHEKPLELNIKQLSTGQSTFFKSQHNLDFNDIDCNIIKDCDKSQHTVPNGGDRDIILEFEDTSVDNVVPLLNNLDKETSKKQKQEEETTAVILDLLDEDKKSRDKKSNDISIEEASLDNREDLNNKRALTTLADKLVENFLSDAVKQFQKIKKDKEEKLSAANQLKRDFINEDDGLRSNNFKSQSRSSSKTKTDNFRTFFDDDQEELSSPEHCNRPESPVLGTSGQEELAKRLAELELSRELFDVLGDEQDWFDEDFGLSSRKQQQKQKRQQQQDGVSSALSLGAGEQVKTPPRPELPVQMKQPEEPAMVVPHTVQEVEKLVIAATQEIWKSCKLGHGRPSLTGVPKPQPSNIFLEGDSIVSDLEAQCQQSYKLAVFDLSWEVIQDIYAEDPKVDQPQWMKPRRLNSSYFHRVKCPNDITTVQEFVTTEVLKLCGLKKEQNQKTDWQKMIKFGRKKRDRVDHILVQELHEEESQWVNYDEDELFVKMQLADGIFDALLKDTADVLTQIQEKKSKRTI
ncbi:centrosome-associated protein 350 isoform X3 [Puntigrus tetrazona]|uniref:centrosome-associated protein 350 isoform X3 n=1 Tax=Puntigrus tetrazona TaxID=1606681 RepID=UPI001C896F21|nr:centrosome-associated protein 350 isoform X3 [Puntigrus tetrazona]